MTGVESPLLKRHIKTIPEIYTRSLPAAFSFLNVKSWPSPTKTLIHTRIAGSSRLSIYQLIRWGSIYHRTWRGSCSKLKAVAKRNNAPHPEWTVLAAAVTLLQVAPPISTPSYGPDWKLWDEDLIVGVISHTIVIRLGEIADRNAWSIRIGVVVSWSTTRQIVTERSNLNTTLRIGPDDVERLSKVCCFYEFKS